MVGFRQVPLRALLAGLMGISSVTFATTSGHHGPMNLDADSLKTSSSSSASKSEGGSSTERSTDGAKKTKEDELNAIVDEYLSDSAEQHLNSLKDEAQKEAVQKSAYLLSEKTKQKGDKDWKDFVSSEMEMTEKELELALEFVSKEYDKDSEDQNLYNLKGLIEDELMSKKEQRLAEEQKRSDELEALIGAGKEQLDKLGQIAAGASNAFQNMKPAEQAATVAVGAIAANSIIPGSGTLISSLLNPSTKLTEAAPEKPSIASSTSSTPTHASPSSTSSETPSSTLSSTPGSNSSPSSSSESTASTPATTPATASTQTETPPKPVESPAQTTTPNSIEGLAKDTGSTVKDTPKPASEAPALADSRPVSTPQTSGNPANGTGTTNPGPNKVTPPTIQPQSTAATQPQPESTPTSNVAGSGSSPLSSGWSPESLGSILDKATETASNTVSSIFSTMTTNTRRHAGNGSRESDSESNSKDNWSSAISSEGSGVSETSGGARLASGSTDDGGANRVGRDTGVAVVSSGPNGQPIIYGGNPSGPGNGSGKDSGGNSFGNSDDGDRNDFESETSFGNYGPSPGVANRAGNIAAGAPGMIDPSVYSGSSADVGTRSPEKTIAYVEGDTGFVGPTQSSGRGISANSPTSRSGGDLYEDSSGSSDSTDWNFEESLTSLTGRGFGDNIYSGLENPIANQSRGRTGEISDDGASETSLAYAAVYNGEPYVGSDGEVVDEKLLEFARGLVKKSRKPGQPESAQGLASATKKPKTDLGGFYATQVSGSGSGTTL